MEAEVRTSREEPQLAQAPGSPPRTLGRYRVVTELGRGSTSIVYLGAVDGPAGFNKLFALKLMRAALAENPALVAMFLAEARVGAALDHPNVVSTLEIDETGPLPFIVMDYLDGQPLQRLVSSARIAFKPLPLHMHLAAISGALEGLAHAHAAVGPGGPLQIVHRDVSPHNVFVTSSGMPKLLDFGCAQTVDAPSVMMTSAGHAAYMSPEQASGRVVDARSDLYAVGVMLWEAVTRRRFWSDEASKAEILRALSAQQMPDTRISALAHAPDDLRAILVKATAPDPSERYQTATALQEDLQRALRRITPPTFDLRDLGQRLVTVFAADRARMQALIKAQQEIAADSSRAGAVPVTEPPPSSRSRRQAADARTPVPAAAAVPAVPASVRPIIAPAPSGPLPSFPMPGEQPRGDSHRRTWTIAAIAASLVVGAGLSAMHLRGDEPSQASARASSPPETASAATIAEPARASVAAPDPDPPWVPAASASVPLEAPRAAEPRETAPVAASASPAEGVRRSSAPFAARSHPVGPPVVVHVESAPAPSPPTAQRAAIDQPIGAPGTNPTAPRPSHPIDAVNPYGP
jgi:eukaryotic-like serine/threonine-protein kinase